MGDITSEKLSLIINGKCSNKDIVIDNFSSLKSSNESSITFFSDRKLIDDLKTTKAKVVILKQEDLSLRKGDWIVVGYTASARHRINNTDFEKNSSATPVARGSSPSCGIARCPRSPRTG